MLKDDGEKPCVRLRGVADVQVTHSIIPRNVPTRKQDLLSFIASEDVMMASTLFVEQKEGGKSRDKRSRIEDAEAEAGRVRIRR